LGYEPLGWAAVFSASVSVVISICKKQKRQPAAHHTSATGCRILGIWFNTSTNNLSRGQGRSTANSLVAATPGLCPGNVSRHN
jgi:hypothetical protein